MIPKCHLNEYFSSPRTVHKSSLKVLISASLAAIIIKEKRKADYFLFVVLHLQHQLN